MKQSQLFTKTRKESPKDEVSKNAELLIRAGYVHKEMAGVYAFLPLGLRVLQNIISIVREEMNAIGGQEISMTALQSKSVWEATNRWDDEVVDVWFKTKLKDGSEVGLGFTHEEAITNMVTKYVDSYRDLPFLGYQFQTKFRNETRAKSGIMRTREFIMKDMYSFCRSQEEHDEQYEKIREAYVRTFNRLGIGEKTFLTFASGGSFSQFSHEFQTVTDAGEDIVYYDKDLNIAINEEVYNDDTLKTLGTSKDKLVQYKTAEVGNIFSLGTKFSSAFNLQYKDEQGENKDVIMGSYGIGPARIMGVMVELLSDAKGIIWPKNVAPFTVHLVMLGDTDEVASEASKVYEELQKNNISVLWDDRKGLGAGEKLGDAELIGIPVRLVISEKSLKAGGVELKERSSDQATIMNITDALMQIKM